MNDQGLFLEKGLIAMFAFMFHIIHVFFHVVVHGILILGSNFTMGADELAVLILRVFHGHILGGY
jgi:hypothetical protein